MLFTLNRCLFYGIITQNAALKRYEIILIGIDAQILRLKKLSWKIKSKILTSCINLLLNAQS